MAYNPFNIFRRNQKAIFAVVTVVIMFCFVLSSGMGGKGDFFEWLTQWSGGVTRKGEVVCKLDGHKIYSGELETLRFNRVMANRFMLSAARETDLALMQAEDQQLQQITDPNTRRLLIQGAQAAAQLRSPFFQMFRSNPQFAPQLRQTEELAEAYENLATSPTAKPAEKEIIRARQYRELLEEQLKVSRGDHFFFNAPNRSHNDLINFMLWQKKADQLGISFTEEDVKRLIQKEFYGYFHSDVQVRKELEAQQPNRFNFDECVKSIGEEFRVRAAQAAILGPQMVYIRGDKTFGGTTIFSPPYEVFEYYRDKCSPTEYEAFAIPGAAFLNNVAGAPTDSELARLYDQYKDDEPNPGRETPGFKIPRQVKLEWISASSAEPYYQKLAEENVKAGEMQAKIGSLLTVPLPGVGAPWVAAATAPLLPKDLLLQVDSVRSEYNSLFKDKHDRLIVSDWDRPTLVTKYLDTSVVRPPTLAAALGEFAGGTLTLAGPLSGLGTLGTTMHAFELRDRILAGAPPVFGTIPGPGMFATVIGGYAEMQALLPKPLTIEAVKPELMKNLKEQTAKQLVLADLKTFSTKVAELSENGAAKDKGPTIKYITEFIATRGLQHGASDKLGSEWTLEDDPGLAPLKAVLTKNPLGNPHGNAVIQFGKKFFWAEDNRSGQRTPVTGTYKPEFYPNEPSNFESPSVKPEPKYLVWRTEETRSKLASGLPQVIDQVRAAWKRIKARDLARSRAEALANQMRGMPGDSPELIHQDILELANSFSSSIADPKVRERVKVFSIRGVCPLTAGAESFGMGPMGLSPFRLASTNDVPYPTEAMTTTLIDERTKPPKTSFVLVDTPKDTYYLVTLRQRDVKKVEDFQFSVYMDSSRGGSPSFNNQTRQGVIVTYTRDEQKKTVESIFGLLKQEFKFEATDDQKKKLEENEKRGGDQ